MAVLLLIFFTIGVIALIKMFSQRNNAILLPRESTTSNADLERMVKRANENIIIHNFHAAVSIADKIPILEPQNYSALIVRAHGLSALNFNLEAIEDYENALKIDNTDPNIHGLLGLVYRKIGDLESGQKYLKASLDKGFKQYEMVYNLVENCSSSVKDIIINTNNIPENLQRRNKSEFIDNFSEVDKNELKEAVKNKIFYLENAIALEPDNIELKNLYKFAKNQIDEKPTSLSL